MSGRTAERRDAERADAALVRRWLSLAVGSLVIAGLFALLLVIGRMPPFAGWITDPAFFKRCLVVHVDLALVVWFYAFLGAAYALLPARPTRPWAGSAGFALAAAGVLALCVAAWIPGAPPVLANYVPVLDHPLALAGLALFGAGVALGLLDGRLLATREAPAGVAPIPDAARPGLRAAALAFLIAVVTFAVGALRTPAGLEPQARYELAFWGGGHVLQFASAIAMVSAWLILLTGACGRAPLGRRGAALLFGALLLPLLSAPLLAGLGTESAAGRRGFTLLMQWGIFPAVSLFLLACLRAVARARREGRTSLRDPRVLGFAASAGLTALGFVLGALIRGSTTMIPAHYHASIGGVTASFMALTYVLLEPIGLPLASARLRRWSAWQPLLFGGGQMVFAVGFALAGAAGMARKAYGAEQAIRGPQEWLGLLVMGLGGLVAVAGGLLYLGIVSAAWLARLRAARRAREPDLVALGAELAGGAR